MLKFTDTIGKLQSRRVELTNEQLASIPRDAADAGMASDKRTAKPRRIIEKGREVVGPLGAFHRGLIAVTLEHQIGNAPDVYLRDHAVKGTGRTSISG